MNKEVLKLLNQFQRLERKVNLILQKMGIDPEDEEEFQQVLDYTALTGDGSLLRAYLRRKHGGGNEHKKN